MTVIKWAYGKKIISVAMGHTQAHGKMPVSHIELLTMEGDHLRIAPKTFMESFEVFPHVDGTICRLKNEQLMKAKELAQAEQVEQAELKERKRLNDKYKDA